MRRFSSRRTFGVLVALVVTLSVGDAAAAPTVRLVLAAPQAVQVPLREAFEQQFAGKLLDVVPLAPLRDETPERAGERMERALRELQAAAALWVDPSIRAAVLVVREPANTRQLNLSASDLNGDGARTLAIVVDSLIAESSRAQPVPVQVSAPKVRRSPAPGKLSRREPRRDTAWLGWTLAGTASALTIVTLISVQADAVPSSTGGSRSGRNGEPVPPRESTGPEQEPGLSTRTWVLGGLTGAAVLGTLTYLVWPDSDPASLGATRLTIANGVQFEVTQQF